MAKNLKKDDQPAKSEWLATYADMMTILFVFFVLLFSMSSINPVKWDILVQTWGNQARNIASVGGGDQDEAVDQAIVDMLDQIFSIIIDQMAEDGITEEQPEELHQEGSEMDFDHIYNVVSLYIDTQGYADRVDIEKDENYVMIRFKDRAFFASGHAIIGAEGQEIIRFIAEAINLVIDQVGSIKIEGHTDNVPQSSWEFPSNWDLGSARANAVRAIFEASGIPSNRRLMEVISLAETDPRDTNETAEGRSANRRVEIYITRADQVDEEMEAEHIIDELAGELGRAKEDEE